MKKIFSNEHKNIVQMNIKIVQMIVQMKIKIVQIIVQMKKNWNKLKYSFKWKKQ